MTNYRLRKIRGTPRPFDENFPPPSRNVAKEKINLLGQNIASMKKRIKECGIEEFPDADSFRAWRFDLFNRIWLQRAELAFLQQWIKEHAKHPAR